MRTDTKTGLDKLQIATVRLADTIHGFFSGNHPASTIDNARAVSILIKNMHDFLAAKNLIHPLTLLYNGVSDDPFVAYINKKSRLLSNFVKHADNDPDKEAYFSAEMFFYPLLSACLDYEQILLEVLGSSIATFNSEDSWITFDNFEGTKTLVLSKLYGQFVLDAQYISETQKRMGQELLEELFNPERRKKYHGVIVDNNLWPVPYHGEISLDRNIGISFERYMSNIGDLHLLPR